MTGGLITLEEFFEEFPEVAVYDLEVFRQYWLLTLIDARHPEGLSIETIPTGS